MNIRFRNIIAYQMTNIIYLSMLVDMIKYWPIEVNNKPYIWMRYGFNDVNIWGSDICLIKI